MSFDAIAPVTWPPPRMGDSYHHSFAAYDCDYDDVAKTLKRKLTDIMVLGESCDLGSTTRKMSRLANSPCDLVEHQRAVTNSLLLVPLNRVGELDKRLRMKSEAHHRRDRISWIRASTSLHSTGSTSPEPGVPVGPHRPPGTCGSHMSTSWTPAWW